MSAADQQPAIGRWRPAATVEQPMPARGVEVKFTRFRIENAGPGADTVRLLDGNRIVALIASISTGWAVQIFPSGNKIGTAGPNEEFGDACRRAERAIDAQQPARAAPAVLDADGRAIEVSDMVQHVAGGEVWKVERLRGSGHGGSVSVVDRSFDNLHSSFYGGVVRVVDAYAAGRRGNGRRWWVRLCGRAVSFDLGNGVRGPHAAASEAAGHIAVDALTAAMLEICGQPFEVVERVRARLAAD